MASGGLNMNKKILSGDWELEDTYGSEDEAEEVANEYRGNGRAEVVKTKYGYSVYTSDYNAWEHLQAEN